MYIRIYEYVYISEEDNEGDFWTLKTLRYLLSRSDFDFDVKMYFHHYVSFL